MNYNKRLMVVAVSLCMIAHSALANRIAVTNLALQSGGEGYTYVQVDVSWDNSWRATWEEPAGNTNVNWDAAWIFVKYRYQGGSWLHTSLDITNSTHVVPAGATISVGTSTNSGGTNFGCGVFLYRSADGSGNWTNTVRLRWNYSQDGLASTDRVDVSVQAIEMVYVPQGKFYIGSGGSENGSFTDGKWSSGAPFPLQITGEAALTIANTEGNLWGISSSGTSTIGTEGTLPAAYPKGYNAFYCMKYEISQDQYTAFLNMLTSAQATTRYYVTTNEYRYNLSGTWPNITNTSPDRACNFMSWEDDAAYADWAGLRPMTELEFEKACRGPLNPVQNEYAWGNTTIQETTNFTGAADGSGQETALPANANCNYNGAIIGAVRCGLYATASSTRTSSGATYWGIMEMSGNLTERTVTVADGGRSFTGVHGDGKLNSSGNATVDYWPGVSDNGVGMRGGRWVDAWHGQRISERGIAVSTGGRWYNYGFRAVRKAP